MEQLAERRMQREQQAAQDLEVDSDADHGEEGEDDDDEDDEDDDDEEEDEEEEVCCVLFHCAAMLICAGAHRGPKDGGGQTHVFNFRSTHVRATSTPGIPRKDCTGAPNAAASRA